ncbi:hypothetical protein HG531_012848 [Fusarium graminearum]|nr:hypothetical protein HG531_012848 [Fusarium graminearum]
MASPYANVGQPQAYQEYHSEPRPGDKLPPLGCSKGGHIHLVPGEVYCRWRHPVTGVLCKSADRYDSLELEEHYRFDHGCKVAPDDRPLFGETDGKPHRQAIQWYADMLQGRMPSWPPAREQDCQDNNSDNTRLKREAGMQDSGETRIQQKDDVEQNHFPDVSQNRQASWSGKEKQPLYLKMEDLPLGTQEGSDRHSAIRLCTLFNQHQSSMPPRVRSSLLHLLKTGQFQHNSQSIFQPFKHQLSIHMYDEEEVQANWINVTYERWFILIGVYGWSMLRDYADGIRKAVVMRYGEPLDGDLTFKNSSDNSGSIVRPFLSQLADEVSIWGPMTRQLEQMIRQQEQTIRTQDSLIRNLQAMSSDQQKQIDKLNAIVGVQSRTGSRGKVNDGDRDADDKNRETLAPLRTRGGALRNMTGHLTEVTKSRKRVRRD